MSSGMDMRNFTGEPVSPDPMSTEPKLGTCDFGPFARKEPHPQVPDCVNWREVESAPAQQTCPTCGESGAAGVYKAGGKWMGCDNPFHQGIPLSPLPSWSEEMATVRPCGHTEAQHLCAAGAETAMTAEQFDENWLRSRHFFVTGCNKGALVTLDDALAYSAHVREAAHREIEDLNRTLDTVVALRDATEKSWAKQLKRTEAAERKLAKLDKVLQEAIGLDFVSSGDHSQRCVCWRCRAEAALASLRAESKDPVD